MRERTESPSLVPFGIPGLDNVLLGGIPRDRVYLIEGDPGAGKTTLAMQFLLDGRARGEQGLYVTLSETTDELRAVAQSHGWDLAGIHLSELATAEASLSPDAENTMFYPSEVELTEVTDRVLRKGFPVTICFISSPVLAITSAEKPKSFTICASIFFAAASDESLPA